MTLLLFVWTSRHLYCVDLTRPLGVLSLSCLIPGHVAWGPTPHSFRRQKVVLGFENDQALENGPRGVTT